MRACFMIILSLFLGALPTPGLTQSIQELLQGQWSCTQEIHDGGGVVAIYSSQVVYNGARVSGVGKLVGTSKAKEPSFESVASYKAKIRVRKGSVYELNRRIKRVSDMLNGERAIVPMAGESFVEEHIPSLFPAVPEFKGSNIVVWKKNSDGKAFKCTRS